MFGPTHSQLVELDKRHTLDVATLVQLLVDRDIITCDDFIKQRDKMIALVDQMYEQRQREANAEALKENPGLGVLASLMGVDMPLPQHKEKPKPPEKPKLPEKPTAPDIFR